METCRTPAAVVLLLLIHLVADSSTLVLSEAALGAEKSASAQRLKNNGNLLPWRSAVSNNSRDIILEEIIIGPNNNSVASETAAEINEQLQSLIINEGALQNKLKSNSTVDQDGAQSETVIVEVDDITDLENLEHILAVAGYEPQKVKMKKKRKVGHVPDSAAFLDTEDVNQESRYSTESSETTNKPVTERSRKKSKVGEQQYNIENLSTFYPVLSQKTKKRTKDNRNTDHGTTSSAPLDHLIPSTIVPNIARSFNSPVSSVSSVEDSKSSYDEPIFLSKEQRAKIYKSPVRSNLGFSTSLPVDTTQVTGSIKHVQSTDQPSLSRGENEETETSGNLEAFGTESPYHYYPNQIKRRKINTRGNLEKGADKIRGSSADHRAKLNDEDVQTSKPAPIFNQDVQRTYNAIPRPFSLAGVQNGSPYQSQNHQPSYLKPQPPGANLDWTTESSSESSEDSSSDLSTIKPASIPVPSSTSRTRHGLSYAYIGTKNPLNVPLEHRNAEYRNAGISPSPNSRINTQINPVAFYTSSPAPIAYNNLYTLKNVAGALQSAPTPRLGSFQSAARVGVSNEETTKEVPLQVDPRKLASNRYSPVLNFNLPPRNVNVQSNAPADSRELEGGRKVSESGEQLSSSGEKNANSKPRVASVESDEVQGSYEVESKPAEYQIYETPDEGRASGSDEEHNRGHGHAHAPEHRHVHDRKQAGKDSRKHDQEHQAKRKDDNHERRNKGDYVPVYYTKYNSRQHNGEDSREHVQKHNGKLSKHTERKTGSNGRYDKADSVPVQRTALAGPYEEHEHEGDHELYHDDHGEQIRHGRQDESDNTHDPRHSEEADEVHDGRKDRRHKNHKQSQHGSGREGNVRERVHDRGQNHGVARVQHDVRRQGHDELPSHRRRHDGGGNDEQTHEESHVQKQHAHKDDGHKEGGGKGGGDHKFEKGEAEEKEEDHHEEHGKREHEDYKSWHEHDKAKKGHHDEEDHKKHYAEKDGEKKEHEEDGGYHEEHHHGEKGDKEAEFGEKGEHNKGHSTKGEHSVHKKDEYEKKTEFFDEFHEDGDHEKDGEFHHEHEEAHGGHHKVGHHDEADHEEEHGKKEKHEKGGHHHEEKGHKVSEGHDGHHHHDEKHGKKEGHEGGKKWAYKKGDDGGGGGGGGHKGDH